MKRLALTVLMALGTSLAASAAPAATLGTSAGIFNKTHSGIVLVRHDDHRWRKHNRWRHHNWRRGHDYDRYRGWHRYHSRPWNWRTRGCAVVGPIWFCP